LCYDWTPQISLNQLAKFAFPRIRFRGLSSPI